MNVYVYFLLCISTLYDYNQSIWVVVTFIYHLTNHSITNFYPQLHAGDIQQDKDYRIAGFYREELIIAWSGTSRY